MHRTLSGELLSSESRPASGLIYETYLRRLDGNVDLFRVRSGNRFCPEAVHENEHRLLPVGPLDPGLDHGACVPVGESWRAGSYWDGRVGGEIRDRYQPFLLDRCGARDDFSRHFHDAFLLRLAGAFGAGISEAPF